LKYQLAMFDLDGVLMETRDVAYRACVEIFETYGVPPPPRNVFFAEVDGDYMEFYWKYGIPRTASKKDLNAIFNRRYREEKDKIQARNGTRSMLSLCRLKNMKTAIVSGSTRYICDLFASSEQLDHQFDFIAANAAKAIAIQAVMGKFKIEPRHAFFVDDAVSGIKAAKSCGVFSVGIFGGFSEREAIANAKPSLMINEMGELWQLIRKP